MAKRINQKDLTKRDLDPVKRKVAKLEMQMRQVLAVIYDRGLTSKKR